MENFSVLETTISTAPIQTNLVAPCSYTKKLNSYEVKITPKEGVDCCFAATSIEKMKFCWDQYTYN